MKFILKALLVLGLSLVIGLLIARSATALAPTQSNYEDYQSGNLVIKNDAIIRPYNFNETNGFRRQRQESGRNYSKEEVVKLIKDYSAQYNISADLPLRIAECESGYNQFAKNRTSTASGVFQYLASTWANTPAGRNSVSVFDAESNVRMAIASIANSGTAPWNASKDCWSK